MKILGNGNHDPSHRHAKKVHSITIAEHSVKLEVVVIGKGDSCIWKDSIALGRAGKRESRENGAMPAGEKMLYTSPRYYTNLWMLQFFQIFFLPCGCTST